MGTRTKASGNAGLRRLWRLSLVEVRVACSGQGRLWRSRVVQQKRVLKLASSTWLALSGALLSGVLLCAVALPGQARAEAEVGAGRYGLRGTTLTVMAAGAAPASPALSEVELGCTGQALLEHGSRLYVACGAAGLVVLSLAQADRPVVELRRVLEGEVVGFWVGDGSVWVKLRRLEARPLTEREVAPAPATSGAAVATPAVAERAVLPAGVAVVSKAAPSERESAASEPLTATRAPAAFAARIILREASRRRVVHIFVRKLKLSSSIPTIAGFVESTTAANSSSPEESIASKSATSLPDCRSTDAVMSVARGG